MLAALTLSACGLAGRDVREDRDPLLRRARERKNAQDFQGAIELYQRALEKRPGLARAHLELGLIFDQSLNNQVRAIYHYERYLELDPKAEKRKLVEDLIRHAKLSFAASLPDRPSEAVREIAMLKQEIAALREQATGGQAPMPSRPAVARAPSPAPPAPAPPTGASATAAVVPAPSPAPPAMEVYVVKPGDTLSRIAAKVYGDSGRWQPIFDANRGALPGGPQSIRVGQTLMVPKLETR